ncbi:peptide deformylase [Streptomyces clavifer]|uniref:peptide deformylase n=1 Tax=Streptomyces clavifer TaxID=68188 RepID=UPI00332D83F4
MVPRPRSISVEHQDIDGNRGITIFEDAVPRLVGHEIDHLEGVLCTARTRPEAVPIPVSEYRGTGHTWELSAGRSQAVAAVPEQAGYRFLYLIKAPGCAPLRRARFPALAAPALLPSARSAPPPTRARNG